MNIGFDIDYLNLRPHINSSLNENLVSSTQKRFFEIIEFNNLFREEKEIFESIGASQILPDWRLRLKNLAEEYNKCLKEDDLSLNEKTRLLARINELKVLDTILNDKAFQLVSQCHNAHQLTYTIDEIKLDKYIYGYC